jgi:hypothetical protein
MTKQSVPVNIHFGWSLKNIVTDLQHNGDSGESAFIRCRGSNRYKSIYRLLIGQFA